jgi:hypothetical protein
MATTTSIVPSVTIFVMGGFLTFVAMELWRWKRRPDFHRLEAGA